MVICLESSVLGGYLSNEVPGLITGMLNIAGQRQPVRMELSGNFMRDIAGCRVDLLNPLPDTDVDMLESFAPLQTGQAGVMTASHRAVQLPRRKSAMAAGYAIPDPTGLKNLIFLEWFNQDNQRILIQSWHLQLRVTAPRWSLSRDAETAQMRQNRARRKHFLLNRSRSGPKTTPLGQAMAHDPFAPLGDGGVAFGTMEPELPDGAKPVVPRGDPVQRSAALAEELRRFERLMHSTGHGIGTKPAVLQLLTTVSDLAAHLTHALRQFLTGGRTQWHFLAVDIEQSLPIFAAAVNACDQIMQQGSSATDSRWLDGLQRCLMSVDLRMRELLMLLREG